MTKSCTETSRTHHEKAAEPLAGAALGAVHSIVFCSVAACR